MSIEDRVHNIVNTLENKKGESIEIFDLRQSSYFVDFVVLVSAFVDKHALALLDSLKEDLKPKGEEFLNIEEGSDWIAIDLGDIIIHIFTEGHRRKFNLEEFLCSIQKASQ